MYLQHGSIEHATAIFIYTNITLALTPQVTELYGFKALLRTDHIFYILT